MNAGKVLTKTNDRFTLIWDNVFKTNDIENELHELREKNNLCHGVSFAMKLSDGSLQAIGIAGHRNDKAFARNVLENKARIITGLYEVLTKK